MQYPCVQEAMFLQEALEVAETPLPASETPATDSPALQNIRRKGKRAMRILDEEDADQLNSPKRICREDGSDVEVVAVVDAQEAAEEAADEVVVKLTKEERAQKRAEREARMAETQEQEAVQCLERCEMMLATMRSELQRFCQSLLNASA
jgi:hypothetical protein